VAFDWKDFLTLASDLAPKLDEASKRTAISRAYYCVFNLAIARAELRLGPRPKRTPSHQWCWEQYKKTDDLTCAKIGNLGDRLKRLRVDADYEARSDPRLDDNVARALVDAREFLEQLARLDARYPQP
jgi:uncharacterized protein (UPF0332 family)